MISNEWMRQIVATWDIKRDKISRKRWRQISRDGGEDIDTTWTKKEAEWLMQSFVQVSKRKIEREYHDAKTFVPTRISKAGGKSVDIRKRRQDNNTFNSPRGTIGTRAKCTSKEGIVLSIQQQTVLSAARTTVQLHIIHVGWMGGFLQHLLGTSGHAFSWRTDTNPWHRWSRLWGMELWSWKKTLVCSTAVHVRTTLK